MTGQVREDIFLSARIEVSMDKMRYGNKIRILKIDSVRAAARLVEYYKCLHCDTLWSRESDLLPNPWYTNSIRETKQVGCPLCSYWAHGRTIEKPHTEETFLDAAKTSSIRVVRRRWDAKSELSPLILVEGLPQS